MTTNAIAISRGLVGAGIERKAADAIAEAVVTHADESRAAKADIANLRAEIKSDISHLAGEVRAIVTQVKLLTGLVAGLYIGLAVLFVDKLAG